MCRSSLILAVLLLPGIFLANIAMAEEANLLLQITSPTPNMSSVTPDCKAVPLPAQNPEVLPAATQMCGACSPDNSCRGVELYSTCFLPMGGMAKCKNLYGNFCSGTPLTHECHCTNKVLQ